MAATEGGGAFQAAFVFAGPWGSVCAGVALPRARGRPPASLAPVPESVLARLAEGERTRARTLPPVRAITWVGGRLALRAALDAAGVAAAGAILTADDGAAILPAGALGSISHKDGLAIALAAADDGAGWRLGVDLEDLSHHPKHDIAPRVLTVAEREAIATLPAAARHRDVLFRFAAKEAIYKALAPTLRRYIGFHEVELTRDSDGVVRASFAAGARDEPPFRIEVAEIASSIPDRLIIAARVRPIG
jgi:phosphopantetheine--protein transferase-like protein